MKVGLRRKIFDGDCSKSYFYQEKIVKKDSYKFRAIYDLDRYKIYLITNKSFR